jgi:branched-chain amino acid transport system permease protein
MPLVGVAVALVLAVLATILPSYHVGLLTEVLILALFAMSLDLLIGYTGLFSLGHAVFFGTAGYIAALLSLRVVNNFWLDAAAALLGTLALAAVFGLVALRTQGPYFLMITMALAQLPWGIAIRWRSLTGGDDGLPGVLRPELGLPWSMEDTRGFFFFVLAIFLVCAAGLYTIVRSSFGQSLQGIRESEVRMRALGYNTWAYKYAAFIVAALFAGVAGVLYVYYNRFVSPVELSVLRSTEGMFMVILGGTGTLFGPAVGAAIVVLLHGVVTAFTERWNLILGLIYVVVIMFAPQGLLGQATGWVRQRRAGPDRPEG